MLYDFGGGWVGLLVVLVLFPNVSLLKVMVFVVSSTTSGNNNLEEMIMGVLGMGTPFGS